ncbi:MAG: VOC family protein [Micrococcales bacterium]|nr:VOC family protein [Micrococcales bacterium]
MSRVQLALNVADLEGSVEFYSKLFGVSPHKRRPGYANFAIQDPPLKLVLIENADRGTGTEGALNHLGVEVDSTADVQAAVDRLSDEGLQTTEEMDTVCCYAQQDKVWVNDPAGAPWEVYTITDDNPVDRAQPAGCCTPQTLTVSSASACC